LGPAANAKEQASPFRLRIRNFDLIFRHDVDLGLAFAKFDCAGDGDHFSLDYSKSLIGRYSGPNRNEASERLIGVFSSEINKCGTQWAARHTDNATLHFDFFADILDSFRVFYHYWLVRTRRNRAEKQSENCDEKTDSHCRMPVS
jgi:hypothetical protein